MENNFSDWITSASRYVGFLDIMGFKDFVARNTHADVLKKLNVFSTIRNFQSNPEHIRKYGGLDSLHFTTFSDSVIIFTKNATEENRKIFMRFLRYIMSNALLEGIPIKGACAFGHVTVDISNQFFFGQPLIDAYLLDEG